MTIRIINADVLAGLAELPDESVHCVVTSPPYWGLRDYGVEGQIGLEPTPEAFVARMVEVFREVRRVLRKDGTCWVNLGDSYSTHAAGKIDNPMAKSTLAGVKTQEVGNASSRALGTYRKYQGLPEKNLIGIPWRVAFALQADGWWLRSDIIWAKPNPMPESVTDRPTKAHEYVFLLTKSERYWYDAEAIKERADFGFPNSPESIASPSHGQGFTRRASATQEDARPPGTAPQSGMTRQTIGAKGNANGFRGGSYVGGKPGPRTSTGNTKPLKQDGHGRRHAGFNERWDDAEAAGTAPFSRNKRSVWSIATVPFPEAHFATFPPELPELCIKAGCPKGGTVLDPFSGAGTTCLVADRLQRNAIGIELNPEYAAMSERRIAADRGGLLDAMEAPE